jgi:hypothetical protein
MILKCSLSDLTCCPKSVYDLRSINYTKWISIITFLFLFGWINHVNSQSDDYFRWLRRIQNRHCRHTVLLEADMTFICNHLDDVSTICCWITQRNGLQKWFTRTNNPEIMILFHGFSFCSSCNISKCIPTPKLGVRKCSHSWYDPFPFAVNTSLIYESTANDKRLNIPGLVITTRRYEEDTFGNTRTGNKSCFTFEYYSSMKWSWFRANAPERERQHIRVRPFIVMVMWRIDSCHVVDLMTS